MLMSFEICDIYLRQGQVMAQSESTDINGTARACAKQEIVLELFCIPVATGLTGKLTVSA